MRRDPQFLPGGPFIGLTTSQLHTLLSGLPCSCWCSQLRSVLRSALRIFFLRGEAMPSGVEGRPLALFHRRKLAAPLAVQLVPVCSLTSE